MSFQFKKRKKKDSFFHCDIDGCSLFYSNESELKNHVKSQHKEYLSIQKRKCPQCKKILEKKICQKSSKIWNFSRENDLPAIRQVSYDVISKISPAEFYLNYARFPLLIKEYKPFIDQFILIDMKKKELLLEIRDTNGHYYYQKNPQNARIKFSDYQKKPKGKYGVAYLCHDRPHEYEGIFPEFFGFSSKTFDWSTFFIQCQGKRASKTYKTFGKKKIYNWTPMHMDLPPKSGVWHFLLEGKKQVLILPNNQDSQKMSGESFIKHRDKGSLIWKFNGVQGIMVAGDLLYFPSESLHEFWALSPSSFSITNAVFNPFYFKDSLKYARNNDDVKEVLNLFEEYLDLNVFDKAIELICSSNDKFWNDLAKNLIMTQLFYFFKEEFEENMTEIEKKKGLKALQEIFKELWDQWKKK